MVFVKNTNHFLFVDLLLRFVHGHKLPLRISARLFSVFHPKRILKLENVVLVFVPRRLAARESKIAQSDTTVTVNKEVTRFEVSM